MKRTRGYVIPLALSAFAAFQAGPAAAVDVFLRLDGINGGSTAQGYAGQIDVLAWSWQLSRPVDNGQPGQTVIRPIKIEKSVDIASAELYKSLIKGSKIGTGDVVVTVIDGKDGGTSEIIKLALKDVIVSGIASGATGGDSELTESVTLTFREVCFTYNEDSKTTTCYTAPF
ncbi:MAG: type VI secretion system tube protein Hcp [Gammaproteobacteria bacterium]|nr:type VI secretion system tube protein Hcp [Gammaproteobacteria bacterium]